MANSEIVVSVLVARARSCAANAKRGIRLNDLLYLDD